MADIEWGDDGGQPANFRRYPWPEIAEQLREREGEWGLVFKDASVSVANAVYSNRIRDLKFEQGFRVRTRNNRVDESKGKKVRRCDIYLAYRPEGWDKK